MQDNDFVVSMTKATVKRLTTIERAGLSCFLVLFLSSVGMTIYSHLTNTDGVYWQFTVVSLVSMMGGFLYGVNRPK